MTALTESAFGAIAEIARREAGIDLGATKVAMVAARTGRRLRALGMTDYAEYCALIAGTSDAADAERRALVNAVTTNVTGFFRERHHFPILARHVAARLADPSRDRVSIWSAGGADGSEAVSALLAVAAVVPSCDLARLDVLVTDIDDDAIAAARAGRYDDAGLVGPDREAYAAFLAPVPDGFALVPSLRARVTVRRHNLVGAVPIGAAFDVVLCRNVLIYFDDATKRDVQAALIPAVRPGGLLMLGHSERLLDEREAPEMVRVGPTAFRRVDAEAAR